MVLATSGLTHVDDVSQRMEQWLRRVVPGADVKFVSYFRNIEQNEKDGAKPSIEICFQSIAKEKADRALIKRDEAFLLTYGLSLRGADVLKNQRILSEIYFAAFEDGDFDIAAEQKGGIDAAPRLEGPAILTLTARLVQAQEAGVTRIVTSPLDLKLREIGRIRGKVVSESGAPIMRAEIEARALNKRTVCDSAGRFLIAGAPGAGAVSLTVTARSKSVDVTVDVSKQTEIVIVMPMEEEHA